MNTNVKRKKNLNGVNSNWSDDENDRQRLKLGLFSFVLVSQTTSQPLTTGWGQGASGLFKRWIGGVCLL